MEKSIITFSANEQNLQKTGGIGCYASDTVSYIEAHFALGENWSGYDSIRAVWFNDYKTISTVLDSDGVCIVPHEVLTSRGKVMVNLVGSVLVSDELTDRLTTFPCEALKVSAKAKINGSETAPITPSQFEQFVEVVKDNADRAEAGATSAEASASRAESEAESALASAQASEASALRASGHAQNAQSAETSARAYAQSAQNYATDAENAKDDAIDARDEIRSMRANAETLESNQSATASYSNGVLTLGIPKGQKGDTGDTGTSAGFGTVSASVDDSTGTPSVEVTTSGTDEAKNFAFAFHNLKGAKGDKGEVSQAEFDEAVSDLKSDLSLLIDSTELVGTEKTGYWRNGVFTENSGTYTKRFNVEGLSSVQLTEYATIYRDAYVFLDSSNNVISSAIGGADPGEDGHTIKLTVPNNAVYLDSSVPSASNLSRVKLETATPKVSTNDINNLQIQINSLSGLDFAVLNGNNANVFYRGETLRTGYTTPYSRKFKVVGGRKYKITLTTGANFNAYTFIDASQNVLSYELATSAESKEYIVNAPNGATMLYCSTSSGTISSISVLQQISETDVINTIAKNEYLASIIHNVICIGDSLTQGYRNDTLHNIEAYSYPTFLSRLANWEVVNAGWAGITPVGWWDKRTLYTYADKQFAIIKLGQNGGLTDTLAEDTSASSYEDYANTNTGAYCKIIEYIREQNPHIIIFVVSVRAYRDSVTNDVLQQIADKYNLPFIDLNDSRFNLEATDIHTISGNYDAVHFNTLGYSQLATSIYDLIVLHLANNKNLMMNYGEW